MESARILVVDDEPHQLASLKRILRRSQYVVDTAVSGRIGLRMAVKHCPDLVLLDISMPTMSGYEFLRRFRRLERRGIIAQGPRLGGRPIEEIPVIFLTGLNKPSQRVDGLDAGAVDYIAKPCNPDELRARIRGQLWRRRSRIEAFAAKEADLQELESSVSSMLTTAQACCGPLSKVDTCLELIDQLEDPEVRTKVKESARQDVRIVMNALSRLNEKP